MCSMEQEKPFSKKPYFYCNTVDEDKKKKNII